MTDKANRVKREEKERAGKSAQGCTDPFGGCITLIAIFIRLFSILLCRYLVFPRPPQGRLLRHVLALRSYRASIWLIMSTKIAFTIGPNIDPTSPVESLRCPHCMPTSES